MKIEAKQDFKIQLILTEDEARALDALAGYGGENFTKHFLPTFYEKLGKHYMTPYEKGLSTLFENIRANIPFSLHKIEKAREIFK